MSEEEKESDVPLATMIKELADEVKKLTSILSANAKSQQAGNKVTKMGVKEHLALIKAQGDMVKSNADYKKSLQNSTDSMDLFTGMLTKGVAAGFVFKKITSSLGGMSTELDEYKKAQSDLTSFLDENKHIGKDDWGKAGNEEKLEKKKELEEARDQAQTKKEGAFGGQGGMSGKLVEGMSGMKEFANKHKTGILIGAGSAGVLIGILKKALDASPMFQQMMKLLNFGIMMVLRPIGDFFGFLFRPILVMLLRKFIIPWYTKMYPVMMKMGNIIGEKLSGAFEALAAGDVAGAFAILFEEVDFNQILTDAFAGIHAWLDETDWDQVWLDIQAGLVAFGTEIWDRILVPLFTAIAAELGKVDWWDAIWDTLKVVIPVLAVADLVAGLFGIGDNQWFNEMGQEIRKWFLKGLDEATTNWNIFWTDAYAWLTGGMSDITVNWQTLVDDFLALLDPRNWLGGGNNDNNNNNQVDKEPFNLFDPDTWAEGGHITEPMAAIGLRSGRQVLMGEAGNETVIPDSQLGGMGGITINIQNMSGSQQDLNNLRQTILSVVQESNSRRGRI
tara:strand:- start:1450 stop:3129 length:1680 start_codon:yes stop_codon:yes gene_type:complete